MKKKSQVPGGGFKVIRETEIVIKFIRSDYWKGYEAVCGDRQVNIEDFFVVM